jgi:hypothetical protein
MCYKYPKLTWQLVNEITEAKIINKDNIKEITNNDLKYNVIENPKEISNINILLM